MIFLYCNKMKMMNEHSEIMILSIVACSLMQLALVMGNSELNITNDFITSNTSDTLVDNQYSQNTRVLRKTLNERWVELGMEKWRVSNKRDDNKWVDNLPKSIKYEKEYQAFDTAAGEKKNDDEVKLDFEKKNELKISPRESVMNNGTNSSTTMPLSTKISNNYNNGLKIVSDDDEGVTRDSRLRQQQLAIKKRHELSSPIASAQKIVDDYSFIELKDLPSSHIIPISLPDMEDENSNGEEFYEEMDELLKLKRILHDKELEKSKKQKQRGDMSPMVSSLTLINDKEKVPVRGDIVTRNKRSYRDTGLWGFAEDEGYLSREIINSNTNVMNNDQPYNKLSRNKYENEKKLLDYIARNRPIVVPNSSKNQQKQQPEYSNKDNQELYGNNKYNGKIHSVMEQKLPTVSVHNYNDLKRMKEEEARINKIPVSARIIITRDRPSSSSSSSLTTAPPFFSRGNFDNEINFPEINPSRQGLLAVNFPAPPTQSPLKTPPDACVWAIVQCCPNNIDNRRLIKCFEYMGCPGVNWDPNPCRKDITYAALAEVNNYYAKATKQ